ncbi:MAG: decarboxylating 6-phosphogluconate dehydrogenase [Dehalococcoidia bacterium]|nr:decarboxylating 6-phosphogluconate dehydrogenase [Dehalococcoidia bacterium]
MKIGIVGLGRMGANMRERLRRNGHEVVGYARDPKVSDVSSLKEMVEALSPPRVAWSMVPSGEATDSVLQDLAELLSEGDIVIDGGNSLYKDSIRRGKELSVRGLKFLDAGTSGGIWGLEVGYCLMVGGPSDAFKVVEPIFKALAPENGYAHVGPSGAGHYTKMVHNGIEYGMLQAYAEGFDLLQASDFDLDLKQIATLWNQGSVVRSWLLELAERAFERDPKLDALQGYVEDSGEGRWTVLEAVERGVAAGVISQSLFSRFTSREENSFAMRVIAALRNEFGGHAVKQ